MGVKVEHKQVEIIRVGVDVLFGQVLSEYRVPRCSVKVKGTLCKQRGLTKRPGDSGPGFSEACR
jgi:hypothetical protein